MKKILLLLALIFSFAFDAKAAQNAGVGIGVGADQQNGQSIEADDTSHTICKIVNYVHGIGGPMITVVIIGAALLAIFGRMPWPALFALGAFTAVFFGAPAIVKVIAPNSMVCDGGKAKTDL